MKEKVLIVDDERLVLEGYRRGLRRRFRVDIATSGQQAVEKISAGNDYALIVSDMLMPGMSGLELLIKVKAMRPQMVRIMLTGNADQKTAVDAVNQGDVFRFLTKPCSTEAMAAAIEAGLLQFRKQREEQEQRHRQQDAVRDLTAALSYQTQHDLLTGLANRHVFEQTLHSSWKSACEEHRTHALCYIDLDHLHLVNDTCGHTAGDELLRQIGNLLSAQSREHGLLARVAGDEFALLLHDCTLDEAEAYANEIQERLRAHHFEWNEIVFPLTASIGLIAVTGGSGSAAELISSAETACHVAKELGRNRIHAASDHDQKLTQRLNDIQWVNKINQALKEDRFRLFFQTINPLTEGRDQGDHYEILLRMEDTEGHIISPEEFLTAAENYQLSPRIDRWVIGAITQWFSAHPDNLRRLSLCSINLSGHSLGDEGMLDFIREAFFSSGVPAEKICLEITETAAVSHLEQAVRFIRALQADGFRFALDDFGTGVSSFAYLRTLPVDFLKIDGMFVKQMHRDAVDAAMVKSINELAHVMGKRTIAEFVENREVAQLLLELGVDYAQGYLITRPRPMEAMESPEHHHTP